MGVVEDVPGGVVIPPELAALVDKLLGYGLGVLAARNGVLPTVPGLDGLRAQLAAAAASSSGTRRRMVVGPARPSYVTVGEAADLLGVSPRRVRRLAASGALLSHKHGRDWLLDRDAVMNDRRRGCRAA